ncbi:multidrug transporter [Pasteurellaceae bacterium Pebbles2]|nr:multidrug transporter [Pasteurellaceae bacterium Pebbles2]
MKWLILLLGIATNAFASVLIKVAVTPPRKFPSLTEPLQALTNIPFWLGLFCYGLAFLLYTAALAKFPMNVAHPILTTGAIALVALLSVIIFKEPMYWTTICGIGLIMLGVIFLTIKVG